MVNGVPFEEPAGAAYLAWPNRRRPIERQPTGWSVRSAREARRRTFGVERHTAAGAVAYAMVLEWARDPASGDVRLAHTRLLRVRPPTPRLNIRPIAEELLRVVLDRRADPRATWHGPDCVTLLPTVMLPACRVKGTQQSRRRRLRDLLASLLAPSGWQRNTGWTWQRGEAHRKRPEFAAGNSVPGARLQRIGGVKDPPRPGTRCHHGGVPPTAEARRCDRAMGQVSR